MKILLKFGIGADSSTFGLPRFATPHYQMGFFKMGLAENLGHSTETFILAFKHHSQEELKRLRGQALCAPINGLRSYFFPPLHDRDKWVPLECGL